MKLLERKQQQQQQTTVRIRNALTSSLKEYEQKKRERKKL